MDDIISRIVAQLAKARPSRSELASAMPLYDPAVMGAATEYADPRNIPDRAKAFAASAADPMGLPSAVVGTVSPSARDNWRAVQERSPSGHMAGQAVGVTGLMAKLPAAASTMGGLARGAVVGGSADAIDAANGNGTLNKQSAMNAILGAIMHPVTRRLPGTR